MGLRIVKSRSPRPKVPFSTWVFLSIGILAFVLGVPHMVNELRLRTDGAITQANVTDWRMHHGKYHGVSYEVRYFFRVPGVSKAYTLSDSPLFWREDLWTSIPNDLWEETKNTRVLDVRYLPAAPETNRPEVSSTFEDALAGILVGLVSCAMAFIFLWAARQHWIGDD